MKKHPIDDLFAQRLGEHSLVPKRANWDEMQKRLQPEAKHRIGVWRRYAVAASVLLILGGSWFVLQKTGEPVGHKEIVRGPTRTIEPHLPVEIAKEPTLGANPLASLGSKNRETEPANSPPEITKVQTPAAAVLPDLDQQQVPVLAEASSSAEPVAPTASLTPTTRPLSEESKEKTLIVRIDEPMPEKILVPESDDLQPKKKRVRIGRLLRQLNNLREGGPVDWKDAGIDGNTLMAKASEAVETGRERITESYETIRTKALNRDLNNK